MYFFELGVWPAEQEGQAARPGGWQTAGSGCGSRGGVRVHSRGGHQDDTDRQRLQVVGWYCVFLCHNKYYHFITVEIIIFFDCIIFSHPLHTFCLTVLPGHLARPQRMPTHPALMPSSRFLCDATTAPPHCMANFHWLIWPEMSAAQMSTATIAALWSRLQRSTAVCWPSR